MSALRIFKKRVFLTYLQLKDYPTPGITGITHLPTQFLYTRKCSLFTPRKPYVVVNLVWQGLFLLLITELWPPCCFLPQSRVPWTPSPPLFFFSPCNFLVPTTLFFSKTPRALFVFTGNFVCFFYGHFLALFWWSQLCHGLFF